MVVTFNVTLQVLLFRPIHIWATVEVVYSSVNSIEKYWEQYVMFYMHSVTNVNNFTREFASNVVSYKE